MSKDLDSDLSFRDLFFPFTAKKILIFLIITGLAVFVNMLFNQFVWDDISYIVQNPEVHSVNIMQAFRENSFNHSGGQYRPLSAFYFSIVYSLFAETSFFYHFLQLVLHIINSGLLFYFFTYYLKLKKEFSFGLALLFLVHPIQVESVSWIAATNTPLFFCFGMLALLFSLRSTYSSFSQISIFVFLLFSLLVRETGICFLVMILWYQLLFARKNFIRCLIIGGGSLLFYSGIRYLGTGFSLHSTDLNSISIPISQLSLGERLLQIPALIFFYLQTVFWPAQLIIDQHWIIKTVTIQNFLLLLIVDIGFFSILVFFLFCFRLKNIFFRLYIFFFVWFLVGLSLHLQLLPLDMTVADRYFYFPFVGLLGMGGLITTHFFQTKKQFLRLGYVFWIIVLLLATRTIVRNANWADNLTLFTHDAALADNFELENNIGSLLSYNQKYDQAVIHAEKSVRLHPFDTNLVNLGYIYEQLNQPILAEQTYQQAISTSAISPNHDNDIQRAYLRWAGMYLFKGDPKKGSEILDQAVSHYPNNGILWSFLAIAEYNMGQKEKALIHAKKAQELLPSQSTSHLYTKILNNQSIDLKEL